MGLHLVVDVGDGVCTGLLLNVCVALNVGVIVGDAVVIWLWLCVGVGLGLGVGVGDGVGKSVP